MVSLIKKPFKKKWENFWKDKEKSKLEKIFYRIELDTALDSSNKDNYETLEQFFNSYSNFFPQINENFKKAINFEYIDRLCLPSNRIKIAYFFNSEFKSIIAISLIILILCFPAFIFLSIIMNINLPFSDLLIFEFQLLTPITVYYIFVYLSEYNYFYGKTQLHNNREKILHVVNQINKIVSLLLALIIFFSLFLFLLFLTKFFLLLLLVCLFNLAYIMLLGSFIIFQLDDDVVYIYYKLRLISILGYSSETTNFAIPYIFQRFIYHFSNKIKKRVNLAISNINEVENTLYRAFMIQELSILKEFGLKLKESFFNSFIQERNYSIELDQSTIKSTKELIENTLSRFGFASFNFELASFFDSMPKVYKTILRYIIVFGLGIIGTLITYFIRSMI